MIKNLVSLALCATVFGASPATTRPAGGIPADKAMKRKIRKILIKDSLPGAIAKCASLAGVKIEVDWPALKAAGAKDTTKVVLRMSDVPVGELLDLTLVQAQTKGNNLAWYIDKDVVRVTSQRRLMHRDLAVPGISYLPAAPKRRTPRRLPIKKWAFDNTAASDVFEVVRQNSGVNIHINWRSLQEIGIQKDTPITLRASNISTARALDLITDELSGSRDKLERVYWLVDDGVLTIATGTALNRHTFTRVFYVADLLTVIPSFRGPRVRSGSSGRGGSGRDSFDASGIGMSTDTLDSGVSLGTGSGSRSSRTEITDTTEERKKLRENLTNIIKISIGEEMWHPQGQGSVQFLRNKMVISQTKLGFLLMGKALKRK